MKQKSLTQLVREAVASVTDEKQYIEEMEQRVLASSQKCLQWITALIQKREAYGKLIESKYNFDVERLKDIGQVPPENLQEDYLRGFTELMDIYCFLQSCIQIATDSYTSTLKEGKSKEQAVKTAVKEVFKRRKTLPPRPVRKIIFERITELPPVEEDLLKTAGWVRTKIKIGPKRQRLTQAVNVRNKGPEENLLEMLPSAVMIALGDYDPENEQSIDTSANSLVQSTTGEIETDEPVHFRAERLMPKSQGELKKRGVNIDDDFRGHSEATRHVMKFEEREHARINLKELAIAAKFAPREVELFDLLLKTPDARGEDLANQMGIATNTVYVMKKRLKDKVKNLIPKK